jgi:hypothetical protein
MADDHFQVVLTGTVAEGFEPAQVKANVAALFKVGLDKVDKLFSGRPLAIKKGLDEATAKKYQLALQRAGAVCLVQDTAPQPAPDVLPSRSPQLDSVSAAGNEDRIPSIDSGLHKSMVKPAPPSLGELESAQLDAPGTLLVEARVTPPAQVDTSALSMDEVGVILAEAEPVPELQLDLSGLSMDEPGALLGEEKDEPTLQVNLDGLSMDEPGAVLVEKQETPEPKIDISKLKLEP